MDEMISQRPEMDLIALVFSIAQLILGILLVRAGIQQGNRMFTKMKGVLRVLIRVVSIAFGSYWVITALAYLVRLCLLRP